MPKRVRIFAGPNGSGKSTIKKIVEDKVKLGTYVNADEIKVILSKERRLDFSLYNLSLQKERAIRRRFSEVVGTDGSSLTIRNESVQ